MPLFPALTDPNSIPTGDMPGDKVHITDWHLAAAATLYPALREQLDPADFGLVLSSPRRRARRTAELAGFTNLEITDDLVEWNYGDYEGLTSDQIRSEYHPGWRLWFNGPRGGETADQVRARLTRVVQRVRDSGVERAVCFSHGHALRVLALCWLDFPLIFGQSFPLATASVSVLGREKESWAVLHWNT